MSAPKDWDAALGLTTPCKVVICSSVNGQSVFGTTMLEWLWQDRPLSSQSMSGIWKPCNEQAKLGKNNCVYRNQWVLKMCTFTCVFSGTGTGWYLWLNSHSWLGLMLFSVRSGWLSHPLQNVFKSSSSRGRKM